MGLPGVGGLGLSLAVHLPAQLNDFLSARVGCRVGIDGLGLAGEEGALFIYFWSAERILSTVFRERGSGLAEHLLFMGEVCNTF